MTVIAVIDYDIGNIKSIFSALDKVGAKAVLTREESEILSADGVILPGVGAFAHGMEKLREYSLVEIIKSYAETNKPLLGICLGMQMLLSNSSEFENTPGLGIISGKVVLLETLNPKYKKLPHVSWNELNETESVCWDSTILDGIQPQENMYFVHSYVAVPEKKGNVLSSTIYSDNEFCSAVKKENIYGCQFHPEKSASAGLKIINNFVEICEAHKNV